MTGSSNETRIDMFMEAKRRGRDAHISEQGSLSPSYPFRVENRVGQDQCGVGRNINMEGTTPKPHERSCVEPLRADPYAKA